MTTVLIVVAHPDDAEIAMGMRIHWYARNGARVHVHCLTTGTPDPSGTQIRQEECMAAASLLGIDTYTFSSIPDTRFVEHRGAIHTALSNLFRDTRPDVVYTHYPDDQHLDHATTASQVTAAALRETANLRYFRSPYSIGFEPTLVFMGTPELLHTKQKALQCFASQQQLDMDLFQRLAEVTYRQFVHHRVTARFPAQTNCAELFRIARQVEFAESS
ncbi:PIG-L deacetylase family protein [Actinomadura sp. SCN-SB]|uniref:PIG-L deacetylase family protein n=1 Tax=Actinomadura sp. SCN-SB TaxID=3373092 RepID=UPI0037502329